MPKRKKLVLQRYEPLFAAMHPNSDKAQQWQAQEKNKNQKKLESKRVPSPAVVAATALAAAIAALSPAALLKQLMSVDQALSACHKSVNCMLCADVLPPFLDWLFEDHKKHQEKIADRLGFNAKQSEHALYHSQKINGVVMRQLNFPSHVLTLIDAQSTVTARAKWHRVFRGACVIVYMVNLMDYAKKLMRDDIKVFSDTINTRSVATKPVILVFTHLDQFASSLHEVPLHTAFPELKSNPFPLRNASQAYDYIEQQFLATVKPNAVRPCFVHVLKSSSLLPTVLVNQVRYLCHMAPTHHVPFAHPSHH
jgi:hypothetical protein